MDDEEPKAESKNTKPEKKETALGSYIPTSEDQSPPQKPEKIEGEEEESN